MITISVILFLLLLCGKKEFLLARACRGTLVGMKLRKKSTKRIGLLNLMYNPEKT